MNSEDPTLKLKNDSGSPESELHQLKKRVEKLESIVAQRGYDTRPIFEKHEHDILLLQAQFANVLSGLATTPTENMVVEPAAETKKLLTTTEPPFLFDDPTVLFSERTARAFPGVRGLKWFLDPEEALNRLALVLKEPLLFRTKKGGYEMPVWWWRGMLNNQISSFAPLSPTKGLMDHTELEIEKIAVYRSDSYYRDFVYVETKAESPIGVYQYEPGSIEEQTSSEGFFYEEYGLYGQLPINRAQYDDGATEIDGKVVEIKGASELRMRYLSPFNFIIAAHSTPFNNAGFDQILELLLNGVLSKRNKCEELIDLMEGAPKNH